MRVEIRNLQISVFVVHRDLCLFSEKGSKFNDFFFAQHIDKSIRINNVWYGSDKKTKDL